MVADPTILNNIKTSSTVMTNNDDFFGEPDTSQQNDRSPKTIDGSEKPLNIKKASYMIYTLLSPNSATPNSVQCVINIYDILINKMIIMMGGSANDIKVFPNAPGAQGAFSYRGSRISLINLKDTFAELFLANSSKYSALDYLGVGGKEEIISQTSFIDYFEPQMAPTRIQDIDGINKIKDNKNLSVGPAAISSHFYTKRIGLENLIYWNQENLGKISTSAALSDAEYMTDTEKSEFGNFSSNNKTFLSPAVINDRSGLELIRIKADANTWDDTTYRNALNNIVASNSENYTPIPGVSKPMDSLSNIASRLNITVKEAPLPLSIQAEYSNNKNSSLMYVGDILGKGDQQSKDVYTYTSDCFVKSINTLNNQIENDASSILQIFSNRLAQTGNQNIKKSSESARNITSKSPFEPASPVMILQKFDLSNKSNFVDRIPKDKKDSFFDIPTQIKQLTNPNISIDPATTKLDPFRFAFCNAAIRHELWDAWKSRNFLWDTPKIQIKNLS